MAHPNAENQNLLKNGDEQVSLDMIELDSTTVMEAEARSAIEAASLLSDLTFIENHAAQISGYLRKNENLKFWNSKKIKTVMNFYINNCDACIMNLFSVLMYDWYELSENSPETYFLTEKFEFFADTETKIYEKLFPKILNVFDDDELQEYYEYCLNIIYFLFSEVKSTIDILESSKQKLKINYFRRVIIPKLIEMVLKLENAEYRTQTLKLVSAFLDNTNEELYFNLKDRILRSIEHEPRAHQSACKISYNETMRHCDELYFKLLFLLNENLMMSFKFEYKVFKKTYQNYFGEYWTFAIKQNAQLLFIFAALQMLTDTKEFLLIITEGANLKSSITSTIWKVAEFEAVFIEPLDKKHQNLLDKLTNLIRNELPRYHEISLEFEELIKNTPKIVKLLFGRKDFKSESLLEEILSTQMMYDKDGMDMFDQVLKYIWNEFNLWEKPEILVIKNPQQKRLFDYVLEKDNDADIISFLMPNKAEQYEEICKPMFFMMLKNSLFYDYKASNIDHDFVEVSQNYSDFGTNPKCLIEYHLNLIDKNERNDYDNTKNLLYLLEEIYQFCPDQVGKNEFFVKLFKKILYEEPEIFDGKKELKLPRKHFWIGLMMIYWGYFVEFQHVEGSKENKTKECYIILHSTSSPNEEISKLEGHFIPYLNLLSLIINNQDDEFLKEFPIEIKDMEKSYKDLYKLPGKYDRTHQENDDNEIFHFYEKYSTNFCFILLYAAIKTNQKNIVKLIFDYNNFLISCPEFPANMIVSDIHHYTVQMFLENKYELGRAELPKKWIPHEVMENFLDSRITCQDNFYKVNCQFMLPYYIHDEKPEKINDGIMMNEDYDTMNYILNDFELQSLVTHPVMEMIIRTKIEKYSRLFFWNLTIFIFTYIGPTIFLVFLLHSYNNFVEPKIESNATNVTVFDECSPNSAENLSKTFEAFAKSSSNWFEGLIYNLDDNPRFSILIFLSLFRIIPVAIREYIQFFYVYENNYFRKISNLIEMGLILLPITFSILTGIYWAYDFKSIECFVLLIIIEAANVLLMIIATAFLYPVLRFAIYMKCFLTVFTTYLMIFLLFLPLFFGCVAMAFIIFDKKLGGKIEEFYGFGNATTKYIVMYAGELEIDSEKLSGFIQVVAITIIIILIINKVNLIISIVVNDVQKVMDQAKEFSLRLYAKKYVEFAEKIRMFYITTIEQPYRNNAKISTSSKFLYKMIKLVTRKYPHIHQIHTLYVEKKTGYVHMDNKRPLFEANNKFLRCLRKRDSWIIKSVMKCYDDIFSHLKLETETMNEIKRIMKRRGKK